MSTLKTNTIQHLTSGFNNIVTHTDGAGTVNAAHARAWVNFDGTGAVAIRSNFNVNSITDNGTGNYTVNFTNALSDANYVCFGDGRRSADVGGGEVSPNTGFSNFATTSVRMGTQDNNADGYQDSTNVFFVLFR